jgi:hypothetical protein
MHELKEVDVAQLAKINVLKLRTSTKEFENSILTHQVNSFVDNARN